MMNNVRFVKYPDEGEEIVVRKLTPYETEKLLDFLLERMGGDRLSDALAELAQEATHGEADSITWD